MAISRSALEYHKRRGLDRDTNQPAPRLAPADLRVHGVPVESPPLPTAEMLSTYEGHPPPDRGVAKAWPGQP